MTIPFYYCCVPLNQPLCAFSFVALSCILTGEIKLFFWTVKAESISPIVHVHGFEPAKATTVFFAASVFSCMSLKLNILQSPMKISLVLWFSFLFCYYRACLSFKVSLVSGHSVPCLEDQKFLLLQLKKHLKFDPTDSNKLVFWNESSPCSEWRGVSWDEEGHVAGLDLSGESISGGLDDSSTLFRLQYLQNLNLAFNNFNYVIPSTMKDLKSLTCLNLSSAGFEEQIPMEIAQLTRLTTLDLSTLYYFEESALKLENPNMVKLVQNLSELRELYLDGITISLKGNEWGHALSSSLPHLEVLSMASCNLSGPIDSSLEVLQNLSIIRLYDNPLSAPVPDFFAKFSNLTQLDLSSCNLRGRFPNKIFQVQSLTSLDLSYNDGLQGSLPDFPQNGSLQTLILSITSFSGALPPSIRNLWKLSRLDLFKCQFIGKLPDSMLDLPELTYLDLSFNNFTGTIPSFGMAKKLTHMDLSQNHLNGGVASAHFKSLVNLVSINLQNNSLKGSIPMSLFLLPLLQRVQFSDNLFQDQLDAIPNVSSSMLQVLDLSKNNLRGPIPQFIFHLRGLKVLQLSSNNFSGTIRLDMFETLQNLTTLDLSNNNLSIDANVKNTNRLSFPNMTSLMLASCNLRQFPGFLRNLSRLTNLDLSNNEIAEKIPRWIWELGYLGQLNLSHNSIQEIERTPKYFRSNNLFVLDLHNNHLQGALPALPALAFYLDYSCNKFSSVIPPDIGNYLNYTVFLSLSHNAFYERIPDSICNASYLQVLDLSYNNFSGVLPHCLTKSETLGVLNLGENNLSGSIPDTFQASCTLKTLDLGSNNLQGPIPKSLSSCTTLEVLNIGNNKIDDQFPCLLKTIPTLQVMVLRRNNFHGPIGCPNMKNMSWKMLQIVDLSFNNFNGTLPGECFPTWKAMMLDKNQTTSKPNQINFNFFEYSQVNYQDQVTVTMKGLEMNLIKILTVFTSIDFSSNRIEGSIPEEMMDFTALVGLNLSNNNLRGQIPSTIWKLEELESLDLSNNSFTKEIPSQLASLSFLSVLDLSFNDLVGKIPIGTQLQSFDAFSFRSNPGLCGPPLLKNCSGEESISTNRSIGVVYADSGVEFDWHFVFTGVGFGVGSGLVVALLMFWDKGRSWSNNIIDKILLFILTKIELVYRPTRVHEAEDDTEEQKSDMADKIDHHNEEDCNFDDINFGGKYCVFCYNLDMSMKKAIHDPRCRCHYLPPISPSTSSSESDTDSP